MPISTFSPSSSTSSKPNVAHLQALGEQRLQTLFMLALQSLEGSFSASIIRRITCPSLSINQRGKIAGSASLQKNHIKLNPQLFHDNIDYYHDQVIAHELAHILVFQLFPRRTKPHGIEWQTIMHDVFDIEPKVSHQLDVTKVAGPTFTYACDCQNVQMSLIRHNKVQNKKQSYICRRCRNPLHFAN